jgi:hypothetical protein
VERAGSRLRRFLPPVLMRNFFKIFLSHLFTQIPNNR